MKNNRTAYIGTKIVTAEPCTYHGFLESKNREKEGNDQDGYIVVYNDGYTSWSPKETFEKSYNQVFGNLNFSDALRFLKSGHRLAREGWNGKGMFVVYQKGYPEGIKCNAQTALAWGLNEGDLFKCNSYFQIKNVDGSHSMWVPSTGDILAEDWVIV